MDSDYAKNSLNYQYSNDTIDGVNHEIKVIKKVAFGIDFM